MQHTKDTVFNPTAATNVAWNQVFYEVKHHVSPIQVLTAVSVA